jgi:lipoyl(octanoyl) transferase
MQHALDGRDTYAITPGQMGYGAALALQEQLFYQLIAEKTGHPTRYTAANYLIALEHEPVITLGKSGDPGNLRVPLSQLAKEKIEYHTTSRGGDITYHGPGQLVVYPIFDLDQHFTDIHRYLRTLEQAVINTLALYGIEAGRSAGQTGVWIDDRKICALGVKASRWVVMHGLALNISTNLAHFDYIVPCNIADKSVTSMAKELGTAPPPFAEVQAHLLGQLSNLFNLNLIAIATPIVA